MHLELSVEVLRKKGQAILANVSQQDASHGTNRPGTEKVDESKQAGEDK